MRSDGLRQCLRVLRFDTDKNQIGAAYRFSRIGSGDESLALRVGLGARGHLKLPLRAIHTQTFLQEDLPLRLATENPHRFSRPSDHAAHVSADRPGA